MTKKLIQNFVGGTAKSDIAKLGQPTTINMFVEATGNDYSVNTVLRGMPGWQSVYSASNTYYAPRGCYKASNGNIFYAYGNEFYCNGTKIGNIASSSEPCTFAETGGHTPKLLVTDGYSLFAVNINDAISGMRLKSIQLPNDPWQSTETEEVPIKPKKVVVFHDFVMVLAKDTDRIFYSVQYPWEFDYGTDYTGDGEQSIYNVSEDDIFALNYTVRSYTEFTSDLYIGRKSIEQIAAKTDLEDGATWYCTESGIYTYGGYSITAAKGDMVKYAANTSLSILEYDTSKLFPEGMWLTADYNNDIATGMAVVNGKLYVTGSKSTQCFVYQGGDCLYGQPFTSGDSYNSDIGAYDNCCLMLDSKLVRIGKNGCYVDNSKVSTDFEDRQITDGCTLGTLEWYSHKCFVVKNTSICLAYDLSSLKWITLESLISGIESPIRYSYFNGEYAMVKGYLVKMTEDSWTEHDGAIIPRGRVGTLMHWELGREFQLDGLRIVTNSGQSSGTVALTVTGDMLQSDTRTMELGDIGDYSTNLEFYDFGTARWFEVKLMTTSSSKFAIIGLEADFAEALV